MPTMTRATFNKTLLVSVLTLAIAVITEDPAEATEAEVPPRLPSHHNKEVRP